MNDFGQKVKEDKLEISLFVSNVVCAFSLSHKIDLKLLARTGLNVRHKPDKKMISMSLKKPFKVSCSIWESGKIVCTGSQSEDEACMSAKCVAKMLQNLGFKVNMTSPKVINVMISCLMPYQIDFVSLKHKFGQAVFINQEINSSVSMKMGDATLKIFHTGKVTVLAPNVDSGLKAVRNFYDSTWQLFQL